MKLKQAIALLFVGVTFGVLYRDGFVAIFNWVMWQLLMVGLTIFSLFVPAP